METPKELDIDIKKADQENLVSTEDHKSSIDTDAIVKAQTELTSRLDELSKALSEIPSLKTQIEELTKANAELTEQNKAMSEKLDNVSNEVIMKGSEIVIIPEQLKENGSFRLTNKFDGGTQ
jgi:regulator of replication initiation timing